MTNIARKSALQQFYRIALVAICLATMAGCATSFDKRGKYHVVKRGQNFWSIASSYNTDPQALAEFNDIEDPHSLPPGTRLYIPPPPKKAGFKKLPIGKDESKRSRKKSQGKYARGKKKGSQENLIDVNHERFIWPLDGRFSSGFGIRDGRRHDGIDVSAPKGTPIRAADSGRVVYSGKLRGYGNIVILKHDDGLFTVYAHNDTNIAKKDQQVKKNSVIAKVGRTGRATGNHLHFEVREGQTARNPLFFLPKISTSETANR